MAKKRQDPHIDTSINTLSEVPDEELGRALKAYLADSDHSSWEGFTSHDRTGIKAFLADLCIYHSHME